MPTGLLLAAPAASLLYSTLAKAPRLDADQATISTRHFLRELNRFGLTSAVDAAGGFQNYPDNYATIMDLARAGQLTVRIAYHLFPQTPGQELDDLRRWVDMVSVGDGDGWLRCNGAGETITWAAVDFENFTEPRPELGDYEPRFEAKVLEHDLPDRPADQRRAHTEVRRWWRAQGRTEAIAAAGGVPDQSEH